MEKSNNIVAITSNDKKEIIGLIIGKERFNVNENETYPEFYERVNKELGYDILENNKPEVKTVKQVEKASSNLMKKIIKKAVTPIVAICIGVAALSACTNHFQEQDPIVEQAPDETEEQEKIINVDEEDSELKAIYEEIMQYEDGEEIVEELQLIDKTQEGINDIAIKNKDAKGKVSYILSEELAAIHDVYNAKLGGKSLLESEEILRCFYFSGEANLINLSQGSRDVQEIDMLIEDSEQKELQIKLQNKTQAALDNYNIAPKGFRKLAKGIYKDRNSKVEAQMEMAWGQPGVALALNNGLTGKELKNYQLASKNEGPQANRQFKLASADTNRYAVEGDQISIKKQELINKALERMNEKNHTLEYDNTGFNPSTTEKGKEMIKSMIGDVAVDARGNYYEINKGSVSHERKPISKKEAEKKFGPDKVKKAEKEAEKKKKVDTNGDGKPDTPIPEANKQEEEKRDELVNDYPKGYSAGQAAFTSGGPSSASSGSASYRQGYRDGYAHAKSVYESQKAQDEKKTEEKFTPAEDAENSVLPKEVEVEENTWKEEEFHEETNSSKSSEVKQVKKVESYINDEYEIIEFETEDGLKISSSIVRSR